MHRWSRLHAVLLLAAVTAAMGYLARPGDTVRANPPSASFSVDAVAGGDIDTARSVSVGALFSVGVVLDTYTDDPWEAYQVRLDYDDVELDAAGIPNGPINTLDQVVADGQTQALGIIQQKTGSELGLVGLPLSFDGVRPSLERTAPALGEDNRKHLG